MPKRELEFTTRLTREDVAGLIEAVIEGLKDGKLKVQKSNEVLVLDVPRVIDLEIEASVDDERAEFEIEISWRTNRAENPDLPGSPGAEQISLPGPKKSDAASKKTSASKNAKTQEGASKPAAAKTSRRNTATPSSAATDAKKGTPPQSGIKK